MLNDLLQLTGVVVACAITNTTTPTPKDPVAIVEYACVVGSRSGLVAARYTTNLRRLAKWSQDGLTGPPAVEVTRCMILDASNEVNGYTADDTSPEATAARFQMRAVKQLFGTSYATALELARKE